VQSPDSGGVLAAVGAAAVRPRWASHGPTLDRGCGSDGLEGVKMWAGDEVEGGRADFGSWAAEKRRWAAVC
jgi:hypothetical protein